MGLLGWGRVLSLPSCQTLACWPWPLITEYSAYTLAQQPRPTSLLQCNPFPHYSSAQTHTRTHAYCLRRSLSGHSTMRLYQKLSEEDEKLLEILPGKSSVKPKAAPRATVYWRVLRCLGRYSLGLGFNTSAAALEANFPFKPKPLRLINKLHIHCGFCL